jgi:small subunit ribosomal protein S3
MDSNWFASKKDFSDKLVDGRRETKKILGGKNGHRAYNQKNHAHNTHRKARRNYWSGATEVDKIREELQKLTGKEVQINILEVKKTGTRLQACSRVIVQQL